MEQHIMITWMAFVATTGAVLVLTRVGGRADRLKARLRDLAGRDEPVAAAANRLALARMAQPLLPTDPEERTRLQARLLHAGLYGRHSLTALLCVKGLLMGLPWPVGLAVALALGVAPYAVLPLAGLLSVAAMVVPGVWLDGRKAARQARLLAALPDFLDLLVLCVEGGLSVHAAFRRVAAEVRTAHPLLGLELNIVEREMQMGLSLGEALRRFADRSGLEEATALAQLMSQTERLGTGLVKVLRTQAETLRFQQVQRAEEQAQKAGAKMLLPMVLFIFPGVFFVILAPGALQFRRVLQTTPWVSFTAPPPGTKPGPRPPMPPRPPRRP